jgi:hypothetical protein
MDDATAKSGCELERELLSEYYWKIYNDANEKRSEAGNTPGFDITLRSSPGVEEYWHWDTVSSEYLNKIGQLNSMTCGEINGELGDLEGKLDDKDDNLDWLNDFISSPTGFMNQMNKRAGAYVDNLFGAIQNSQNKTTMPSYNQSGKMVPPWTYDSGKWDAYVEGRSQNTDFRLDVIIQYEEDVVSYYEELYEQVGPETFCKMMFVIGNEHAEITLNPVDINSPDYENWAVNAYRAEIHAVAFSKMKNIAQVSQECQKIITQNMMNSGQSAYSQQQNPNLENFQKKLQNNEYDLPNPDDVDKWLDDKMGQ